AWTVTAACTTPSTCGSDQLSGAGVASSTSSFRAGTYSLSESSGPSGYTPQGWTCTGGAQNGSNITLGLGQSANCTITNDDQKANFIVKKVVLNNNGGTAVASNFSFKINNGNAVAFNANGSNTVALNPGTYTV